MSWPISRWAEDALRGQYRHDARVDIYDHVGTKPILSDLHVTGGSVTWDLSTGAGHARGNFVVPFDLETQDRLVPTTTDSPLTPMGHRARIRVGISDEGAGDWDWVDWGHFYILNTVVERPANLISVNVVDIAWLADQVVFEKDSVYKAGADLRLIIRQLMNTATGLNVSVAGGPTRVVKTRKGEQGKSFWSLIETLARDADCEAITRGDGDILLVANEDGTSVVESINMGEEILSSRSEISRAGVVNRVKVILTAGDDTYVGNAQIKDGPLRYGTGTPMGPVTRIETASDKKGSKEEAIERAGRLLARQEGLARTIDVDTIWLPHIRHGDFVEVSFGGPDHEDRQVHAISHTLNPSGDVPGTRLNLRWDARSTLTRSTRSIKDIATVASYNQPDRYFGKTGKEQDDNRRAEIKRLWEKSRASVIGIQEHFDPVTAPKGPWGKYSDSEPVAVFWREDIWDKVANGKVKTNDFTATPGPPDPATYPPRFIVWVDLRHRDTGITVRFGSVHLTAYRSKPIRDRVHRGQVEVCEQWLKGRGNRVLLGDFNAPWDSTRLKPLRNVARVQHAPTHGKGSHIDLCFSNRGGDVTPSGPGKALRGYRSDHKPLLASLLLRSESTITSGGGSVDIGLMGIAEPHINQDILVAERAL